MPEFILNTPSFRHSHNPHPYFSLSELAKGYVEAMFFTNGDTGDEREDLLNELGVERLTKASVKEIKARVSRFEGMVMPDGCFARQWIDQLAQGKEGQHGVGVPDDQRAGHMLWYATQGHGVAWTDDYSPDQPEHAVADGLQDACRKFGECYVEVSRGWIYVR